MLLIHGGIDDTAAWTEGGEERKFEGAKNNKATGQVASNSDRIVVLDDDGEAKHGDTNTRLAEIEYLERHKDKPDCKATASCRC